MEEILNKYIGMVLHKFWYYFSFMTSLIFLEIFLFPFLGFLLVSSPIAVTSSKLFLYSHLYQLKVMYMEIRRLLITDNLMPLLSDLLQLLFPRPMSSSEHSRPEKLEFSILFSILVQVWVCVGLLRGDHSFTLLDWNGSNSTLSLMGGP